MINNKSIQAFLQERGYYHGKVDGILGMRSDAAIHSALLEAGVDTTGWTGNRLLIGVQQLMFIEGHIDRAMVGKIDGMRGPMFDAAFERWQDYQRIAPMWNPTGQHKDVWPKQADVERFFGKPGENLVTIELPYVMRIAWKPEQRIKSIRCNKLVSTSLTRVLTQVMTKYDALQRSHLGLDIYSGGFNIRPMKSSSKLSMHAYGIAFDFDDQHNTYRMTHAQARFAQPEYEAWWSCWEEEGWVSLGRERDFDWMHVQAARL